MPKVVITGAHGFVGRHVVDAILALPNDLFTEICVVDRTAAVDAHARAVRDARLRFVVADLLTDAVETAAAKRYVSRRVTSGGGGSSGGGEGRRM